MRPAMTVRCACLVSACAFGAEACVAQSRPTALENLERSRKRLATAEIEWSLRDAENATEIDYTSRFSEGENILVYRGDKEGVVSRLPDGKIAHAGRNTRYTLIRQGEAWQYKERTLHALLNELGSESAGVWTMRTLGAAPKLSFFDLDDTLWRDRGNQPGARKYSQVKKNGLYLVTAETDYGRIEWHIDPEHGWSPIRTRLVRGDEDWYETRSSLRKFGDTWYPDRTVVFTAAYKGGREPLQIVTVHSAVFNSPEHPRRLTPRDIGVEIGLTIQRRKLDGTVEPVFWDGENAVPWDQYYERLRAGKIEFGTTLRDIHGSLVEQKFESDDPDEAPHPYYWEEYTRHVINKYDLDADQAQRAWSILLDCKRRANEHVQRVQDRYLEIQEEIDTLRTSGSDSASEDRIRTLQAESNSLGEPVNRIFHTQLKPRLLKIPTRAQQTAVEQASSSSTQSD